METKSAVFLDGLYLGRVSDKAPEFIITNQTIHVDRLKKWLDENASLADEKGYIKIVGKEAKDTVDNFGNKKRYFQVDTFKPEAKELDDKHIPF
jgi:hypothetical protein